MNTNNNRILLVDDNRAIHDDYRKILSRPQADPDLSAAESMLFGPETATTTPVFALTCASQGEEAVEFARVAHEASQPFAVAFVDMRMPPGIDGLETAQRLWEVDPDLQVVICSAYSDHSWTDMSAQLGAPDRWVILKKPFDNIEVLQIAHSLVEKWMLRQQTRAQVKDLEQRVAERTADLEGALQRLRLEVVERERGEEERRLMERKLEESQRLEGLGVLAGGVAHDFNNILTGILASASLAALDAPGGSEMEAHLRRIEENSRRAAGLCEQLLTYAGKGQVRTSVLDLNVVLQETLELLHISVPKDAELAVELAARLPLIRGDASRLRQVFMNLVLNAAEALAEPPRRVRLLSGSCRLDAAALRGIAHPGEAAPGEFVFIEVSDTGIGMSAETIRRIFEPFYTTKFTGRGLGLCAVLGIMRHHGGALDVSSTKGSGTTFRIYLPAVADETLVAERPAAAFSARRGVGTVLVVDDEESVRFVAATALKRHGFNVVTASDGEQATAMAASSAKAFDGVLLDVTMPRMDGITALGAIREIQPEVPVVLMSGFAQGDIASRVAGMSGVTLLQKPFTVDDLVRCAIEQFVDKAGAPETFSVVTVA
ncbi:MAG: response regulator [Opitutaceae bacterium]